MREGAKTIVMPIKNHNPRLEFALLAFLTICTCIVFMRFEITEWFMGFAQQYEE